MAGNREEIQTPNPAAHPLLLITDRGINNEKQYLYNISENRFRPAKVPEFHDMEVLASAYGWIVLADPQKDNCYIWNPSSQEKIEIGILMFSFIYNKCVMSNPPSEPGYCHIMFYSPGLITPDQCLLMDGQIVAPPSYMSYVDYDNEDVRVVAAASFRGKIYCIVNPGLRFITVDFDGTTLKYSPIMKEDGSEERPWVMPNMGPDSVKYVDIIMIESTCRQEFWLVHKMFMCDHLTEELDFRVFRVDIDRRECLELDNIGERAFFMSYHGGCFCFSSSSSSRGIYRHNCIYYTIPKKKSRCVYVYNLDDRSTTLLLPCPAARCTRSMSNWIENIISTQQD